MNPEQNHYPGHRRKSGLSALLPLLAFGVALCSGAGGAQEYSRSMTAEEMPSLANSRHGGAKGTLKVCSKPAECFVSVAGQQLRKDRSVLTVDNLKPGVYDVTFRGKAGNVTKRARVAPGQTTVVFASLDAAQPDNPNDPYKDQPAEPSVNYAMRPAQGGALTRTWSKVTGKQGDILPEAGEAAPAESPSDLVDAQITFELAQLYQKQFNPFSASRRYERALELYQHIIEDFPKSPYVELAHYYSGRIYESRHRKEYNKALTEYQTVLQINPQTGTDAPARIASLYGGAIPEQAQPQLAAIKTLDEIPPAQIQNGSDLDHPVSASSIGVSGPAATKKKTN